MRRDRAGVPGATAAAVMTLALGADVAWAAPPMASPAPPSASSPSGSSSEREFTAAIDELWIYDDAETRDTLADALAMRTGLPCLGVDTQASDLRSMPGVAAIVIARSSDLVSIRVVLGDGRAWRREVDRSEFTAAEDEERAIATAASNLLVAILDELIVHDEIVELAPLEPVDDPQKIDPEPSQDLVDDAPATALASPSPALWLALTPRATLGLGPPSDAARSSGLGGMVDVARLGPRGLLVGGRGGVLGAGTDAIAVVRGRVAALVGYVHAFPRASERGEVSVDFAVGLDPWSPLRAGRRTQGWIGDGPPRRTFLGLSLGSCVRMAIRAAPATGGSDRRRNPRGGGIWLRVGAALCVDWTFAAVPEAAGVARVHPQPDDSGADPIAPRRVGGLEVGIGLELGIVRRTMARIRGGGTPRK